MAPFSVSDMKEKASQVKSAGIKSYGSARDKFSGGAGSSSTARAKPPPPPPPSRRVPASHGNDLSTTHSHTSSSGAPSETIAIDKIDWAKLSYEDKQAFFTWLDEFFARYLDLTVSPTPVSVPADSSSNTTTPPSRHSPSLPPRRVGSRPSQDTVSDPPDEDKAAPTASRRTLPPMLSQRGPPKINLSTKPSTPTVVPDSPRSNLDARSSYPAEYNDLQMSFPPPTTNGSAAADLASFMHPSTPWDTEWYASDSPIPPYLQGSPDMRFAGSFGFSGHTKDSRGVILFSDLSMCWYSVSYGNGRVTRWARFRPRPEPMSSVALQQAADTYGAAVATFAERAVASGKPVARGECWDVAHEGLLYAGSLYGPRDAPILSTSRAHGHLLFCGKPGMGRWRGGDDRFRAGDIVEWRSVRIGTAQHGGLAFLGDPDHTAVLVEDTVPRCAVADGDSVKPADVGVLTVVEQSAGQAPKRDSYDLAKLQTGEVWVYRPVSMVEYLGSTLSVDIPPGLETHAI